MEMDTVTSKEPDFALDAVPSFAETLVAIGKLTKGKAAGPDGISPEVLQELDITNARILHETFVRAWEGIDPMPIEWCEAFLVPLPKKGDLEPCVKAGGAHSLRRYQVKFSRVSLMVVCRSIVSKVSQCGFRAGRGVMDRT